MVTPCVYTLLSFRVGPMGYAYGSDIRIIGRMLGHDFRLTQVTSDGVYRFSIIADGCVLSSYRFRCVTPAGCDGN